MKKSKFLKKSLAMLLALMLVVAMIPLSAAAAAPVIHKVTVGGVEATPNGTTYSAEITEPAANADVTVTVELQDKVGTVAHHINLQDDSNASYDSSTRVWKFNLTKEEKAAGSAEFLVLDEDGNETAYTISFTTVKPSDNTGVEEIHLLNGDGEPVEYAVSATGRDYTIVASYGYNFVSSNIAITVASGASVAGATNGKITVSDYDTKTNFTVSAANNANAQYSVTVVEPAPFASFAVEGERHASQISRVTEDPNFVGLASEPKVEVYFPYSAKINGGSLKFTPSFTTNYTVKVEAKKTDGTWVEFISGEEYDAKDFIARWATVTGAIGQGTVDLKVTYSDNSQEEWNLELTGVNAQGMNNSNGYDPEAVITSLTVDNYVATIEGRNITLSLPASVRTSNANVVVGTSKGTAIKVVNTTVAEATGDANDTATISGLNLKGNTYTLQATAGVNEFDADQADVRDYYLTIETAQVTEPKMTNMTLQRVKPDGTVEKFDGAIDHAKGTITFSKLPYRLESVSEMAREGWKLFWTATSGCTVTSNGQPIKQTGTLVDDAWTYLPESNNRFDLENNLAASTANDKIVVAHGTTTQDYTILFDSADASRNADLGEIRLAYNRVDEYSDLDNTNNIVLQKNGNKLTGSINFSEWEFYKANSGTVNGDGGGAVVTTLPEGAELYYVTNGGKLSAVDVLNEGVFGTIDEYIPRFGGNYDYGKPDSQNTASYDGSDPLKLIVVSQAAADDINDDTAYTTLTGDDYEGMYKEYTLTLTQKAANKGFTLTKFNVYDAFTGTTVEGEIEGDDITLTIPYYFTDASRNSVSKLYLDYATDETGAQVTANSQTVPTSLVYDMDGNLKLSSSLNLPWNNTDKVFQFNGQNLTTLTVTAENGKARSDAYNVTVVVEEPETEAVLNSVTVAGRYTGRPDADNNVTITVPYGTEVTSLAPEFDVSTNAYVVEGDAVATEVIPGATYNFYNPRQFTVVAENHVKTNLYTITVVVSDEFTDVPTDAWYYENVMGAVANGYMSGMGDGTFEPMGETTRAQFACAIASAMGFVKEDGVEYDTPFTDVKQGDWYDGAVAYCYKNGIIGGYEDGTFKPTQVITRQEAAAMLNNAFKLAASTDVSKFTDADQIASWATAHVAAASAAELMNGNTDGSFNPNGSLVRAGLASILMNAKIHSYID